VIHPLPVIYAPGHGAKGIRLVDNVFIEKSGAGDGYRATITLFLLFAFQVSIADNPYTFGLIAYAAIQRPDLFIAYGMGQSLGVCHTAGGSRSMDRCPQLISFSRRAGP